MHTSIPVTFPWWKDWDSSSNVAMSPCHHTTCFKRLNMALVYPNPFTPKSDRSHSMLENFAFHSLLNTWQMKNDYTTILTYTWLIKFPFRVSSLLCSRSGAPAARRWAPHERLLTRAPHSVPIVTDVWPSLRFYLSKRQGWLDLISGVCSVLMILRQEFSG